MWVQDGYKMRKMAQVEDSQLDDRSTPQLSTFAMHNSNCSMESLDAPTGTGPTGGMDAWQLAPKINRNTFKKGPKLRTPDFDRSRSATWGNTTGQM